MKLKVALVLLAFALSAAGQVTTSQISGVVKDSSGAPMAGVTVRVVNEQNALKREAVSGSEGFYVVSNLPPGEYSVRVEHAGFKTFKRDHIAVSAGDRADVSPSLEVGS